MLLFNMPKSYNVVIIARNEEQNIRKTINALKAQDLAPNRIIVVNDGSTDKTPKILRSISKVEIITNLPHEDSYLWSPGLESLRHQGFIVAVHGTPDYILSMDADIALPSNHCAELISRMLCDNIVIASGVLAGEHRRIPIDGCCMINARWLTSLGITKTGKYGYDMYYPVMAYIHGYRTAVYWDLVIPTMRTMGAYYNAREQYRAGRTQRALGFSWYYALGRALFSHNRKPLTPYHYMRGYFTKTDLLDPEIRRWMQKYQKDQIRCRLLRKKSSLLIQNKNSIIIGGNVSSTS